MKHKTLKAASLSSCIVLTACTIVVPVSPNSGGGQSVSSPAPSPASSLSPVVPADLTRYQDKSFYFDYPATWEKQVDSDPNYTTIVIHNGKKAGPGSATFVVAVASGNVGSVVGMDYWKTSHPGARDLTLDGWAGLYYENKSYREGVEIQRNEYFSVGKVEMQGTVGVLYQYDSGHGSSATLKQQCEATFASFRWR